MSTTTESKLIAYQCNDCNYTSPPPMPVCPSCGSENLTERELSGKGKIYTFTIVHMGFGQMATRTPYILAIAELEEGLKLTTVLAEGSDVNAVQVDDPIVFSFMEDGVGPIFKKV